MNIPVSVRVYDQFVGRLTYLNPTTKMRDGMYRYWRNVIIEGEMATFLLESPQDVNSPAVRNFDAILCIINDPMTTPECKFVALLGDGLVIVGDGSTKTAEIQIRTQQSTGGNTVLPRASTQS